MQRVRDARRGDGQAQLPASGAASDAGSGLHFSDPRLQQHLQGQARPCAVGFVNPQGPMHWLCVRVIEGSRRRLHWQRLWPVALFCRSGNAVLHALAETSSHAAMLFCFMCMRKSETAR